MLRGGDPCVQRLRGGSGFRGMWGGSQGGYAEPRVSNDELKKNVQKVLEKHPSGIMGRDFRRLYKEVTGKELPVQDFSVQRPIELVEKELSDTVYYTRSALPLPAPRPPPPCTHAPIALGHIPRHEMFTAEARDECSHRMYRPHVTSD